ncbi:MAG: endolytic transglycosylase MltG [bacterium]
MGRRIRIIPAAGVLIVVLTAVCGFYTYYNSVNIGNDVVTVIIEPGDSFSSVADKLFAEGVVTSRRMLTLVARLMGIDKKLTPGRYDFTGRNSCRSVLDRLRRGDVLRIRVTIQEGAPLWKVASILNDRLDLDSAIIANANHDTTFLTTLGLPCLEGYLYPETYLFPWGVSEQEVLRELVKQYHIVTDTVWPDSIMENLTRSEIIILASIIEAETRLADEREVVASVYINRLRRNMKLDADPTVIYGLGGLDRPLNRRDIKIDTPYNTYQRKGLPPTPINSPGLAAIRAALHPAETDYLYFVADENGGHHFSRTNAEHNRAKQRIKNTSRP